jgi:hypothetical protein
MNNNKKVCTLIPIHRAKFDYGLNALKSYHTHNLKEDLYFVFSNEDEYREFSNETTVPFLSIIMPLGMFIDNNPITKKKLFGLNYLFGKGYDLVGVLDADILFVDSFDPRDVYADISNRKYFKSNISSFGGNLIKHIATKMEIENDPNLLSQTLNYTQYWWFNDIPVYEKHLYLEFYQWLVALKNYEYIAEDWWCFDYLLYSIWLIVYKDYKLQVMDPTNLYNWGAIEDNLNSKELSFKFKSYADAYSLPDKLEHIKVQLHVDRLHLNNN